MTASFKRSTEPATKSARNLGRWFVGISRHGVIAAERMLEPATALAHHPVPRTRLRQGLSLFAGSMLIGLGVSLFVHARLGVPAYDVMLTALRDQLGVTLGQAGWLFTGFLFLVAAILGQRPGLSAVAFIALNGVAVDVAIALVRDPEPLAVRILFVILGTLSIAAAVAIVVHAGLSGGATELLMRAGDARGLDPYRVRQGLEFGIVIAGVTLGGDLGAATVFFVLTMSPALKAGQMALADHRRGRAARMAAPLTGPPIDEW
ncbi:MAG: YczE/YyaS/YitT family protein [Acidimicrobiales bacterium]